MGSCNDMVPVPMLPPEPTHYPESGLLLEEEKPLAMELAMSSMDELVKMCQASQPLWIRNNENGREVLNLEEHARMFAWPLHQKQHSSEFRTEATRHSAVVIMNSITLVDAFLDAVSSPIDSFVFPSDLLLLNIYNIQTSGYIIFPLFFLL